jgi:predicted trehalose synthase
MASMLTIERTDQEIIIRLPLDMGINDIQRMLDYLSYKQAIKNSQATQEQIDELAETVKSGWWEKNKDRFPGLADA